jgi:transposase
MELSCKRCGSTSFVKQRFVRGLQRHRCKTCALNFTATPKRGRSEATKASAFLLYSFGKASFRWLGKLLDVSAVSAYKWVRQAAEALPEDSAKLVHLSLKACSDGLLMRLSTSCQGIIIISWRTSNEDLIFYRF